MLDFLTLAQTCAPHVAPQTMAAIVKTESQFQPLAIGINGGARLVRQPSTKEEAVITAKWLIGQGYNIDMGLGQVNSSNLIKTRLNVEDAFDPCKNLQASSYILKDNYQRAIQKTSDSQVALLAAISAYNTGNFSKGFSNGYVKKVVANSGATQPIPIIPVVKVQAVRTLKPKLDAKPVHPKATPSKPQEQHQPSHEENQHSWDVFKDF